MSMRNERDFMADVPRSPSCSTQTASSISSGMRSESEMFNEGSLLRNPGERRPSTGPRRSGADTASFLGQEAISSSARRGKHRLNDRGKLEKILKQRQHSLPCTTPQSETGWQRSAPPILNLSSCKSIVPLENRSLCATGPSEIVTCKASEVMVRAEDTPGAPCKKPEENLQTDMPKSASAVVLGKTTHNKTKLRASSAVEITPGDQITKKHTDVCSSEEAPARQKSYSFETSVTREERIKSSSELTKQENVSFTMKKCEGLSREPHRRGLGVERDAADISDAASALVSVHKQSAASARSPSYASHYSTSPHQLSTRRAVFTPGYERSLRTISDVQACSKDPTSQAGSGSLRRKTPPRPFEREDVVFSRYVTSTSGESTGVDDSSSLWSVTTESPGSSHAAIKTPALQVNPRHLEKTKRNEFVSSTSAGPSASASTILTARSDQTAHPGSHELKSNLLFSSLKSRSRLDDSWEKAVLDKKRGSPKEQGPPYTGRRSTRETKTATPPSLQDQAHVVIRSGQQNHAADSDARISKEHGLYPFAVCLSFALALGLCYMFWPSLSPLALPINLAEKKRSVVPCATVNCLRNSRYLSDLLSWSDVTPCDDFYAFTCRRWSNRFVSAVSHYPTSADDDFVSFLEEKIHSCLQDAHQSPGIIEPLKILHDECMNVRRVDYEGLHALRDLMGRFSLDGFPFSRSLENMSVWTTAAQLVRATGTAALLSVSVASHPLRVNTDVMSIGPPEFLSSNGHLDSSEVTRLYTEATFLCVRIMKKASVPPADVLSATIFASDVDKLAEGTHEKSPAQIIPLDSRLDVKNFISEILRGQEAYISNDAMQEVLIWPAKTTRGILDLVAETNPHTVLNYLVVRLMIQVSPFMPYSKLLDLLTLLIYGKTRKTLSRWRLCVRVAEKALSPLAYASLFSQPSLHTSMPSLVNFVNEVVKEFRLEIQRSKLLDQQSKKLIGNAIAASAIRLIGPSWTNGAASVNKYADKLPDVTAARWGLGTYMAYYEYTFFYTLSLGSHARWGRPVFTTDCWYEPNPGAVYVPLLAFNATQVLSEDNVDALQLSRLGPRLSRCLFDMLLDEANTTKGTTRWLTDATWSRFIAAEACLGGRRDYVRFGRLRDVLAARVALRAFQRNVGAEEEMTLRLGNGRIMTSTQVFFAYLMLQSCESGDGLGHWMRTATGNDWWAALLNSEDFRLAYNCSAVPGLNSPQECAM